jgi:hypothetical protein
MRIIKKKINLNSIWINKKKLGVCADWLMAQKLKMLG